MDNNFIFPIEKMCKVLKVSRSSYYSWLVREPGQWDIENDALLKRIIMAEEPAKIGTKQSILSAECRRSVMQKKVQFLDKNGDGLNDLLQDSERLWSVISSSSEGRFQKISQEDIVANFALIICIFSRRTS